MHTGQTLRDAPLDWDVPRQLTPRKWHRREVLPVLCAPQQRHLAKFIPVGDGNFEHPMDARFVEPEAVTELDPTPHNFLQTQKSSQGWPDSRPDDQRLTHMCGPGPCASTRQCGKCLQVWIAITRGSPSANSIRFDSKRAQGTSWRQK